VNRGDLALVLLAGLLAPACSVDDRAITVTTGTGGINNPPPSTDVVIATFESGTLAPDDPRFSTWKVEVDNRTQGPNGQLSIVEPDGRSGHALQLVWEVHDVADGQPNNVGVLLVSSLITNIDLSAYSSIVFAHRYEHQGPCQQVPLVTFVASCNGTVETFASLSPAWTATTIPFADLQPGAFDPAANREDCLRQVNEIDLRLQVSVSDGDCASGTLWLDDVALRF
jgi:hypothetical protein